MFIARIASSASSARGQHLLHRKNERRAMMLRVSTRKLAVESDRSAGCAPEVDLNFVGIREHVHAPHALRGFGRHIVWIGVGLRLGADWLAYF
jgi:hypothetical protein